MSKLSDEERTWYDRFVDCHYGGDMRSASGTWSPEQQRAAWTAQRVSREDAYGLSNLGGTLDEIPRHAAALDGKSWSATPAYLDDEEYKAALREFRAHLAKPRKPQEPVYTLPLLRARRALNVLIPVAPQPEVRPKRRKKP